MGVRGTVRGDVGQDGVEGGESVRGDTSRVVPAIQLQVGVTVEARVTDVVDQVVVEERVERRILGVRRWQVLPN